METAIVGAVLVALILGATVLVARSKRRRGRPGDGDGDYSDDNHHRSAYDGGDGGGDGASD